jgi:hypothetical protein
MVITFLKSQLNKKNVSNVKLQSLNGSKGLSLYYSNYCRFNCYLFNIHLLLYQRDFSKQNKNEHITFLKDFKFRYIIKDLYNPKNAFKQCIMQILHAFYKTSFFGLIEKVKNQYFYVAYLHINWSEYF